MTNNKSKGMIALLLILLSAFHSRPLMAAGEEAIHSIAIDIELERDGTAHITETWNVTVNSGTEMYLVQGSLGAIEIQDFTVTDETGLVYENIGNWDVDRSLEEKAGKCGIHKTGYDLELCWGKGSYGTHTYTVSYTMTHFVKKYTDGYYGFNQRIINDQLSGVPQDISAAISVDGVTLTTSNTKIWAFGYPGEIWVQNGQIEAYSTSSLQSSSYMTILARLDPEVMGGGYEENKTFEEVREKAFVGSSYQDGQDSGGNAQAATSRADGDNDFLANLPLLSALFIAVVMLLLVRIHRRHGKAIGNLDVLNGKRFVLPTADGSKPIPPLGYWREPPAEGDLCVIWYLTKQLWWNTKDGQLLGACLLHWAIQGCIKIEKRTVPTKMGLSSREETVINLFRPPEDRLQQELFELMDTASLDGILEEKELGNWAKINYRSMVKWLESFENKGEMALFRMQGREEIEKTVTIFKIKTRKDVFTESGLKLAAQTVGFKQYLNDFTLLSERPANDVQLWRELLVFAALYGIADQVAQEMKKIYPDTFAQLLPDNSYGDQYTLATLSHVSSISKAAENGIRAGQQADYDGGGGSSSFGGGGGSSGGGSGGGSR